MKTTQLFKKVSEILSVCIFLAGLVVLVGWILDIPILKSISPNFVTMKANTAICFALIGVSLWLSQEKRLSNRWCRTIAHLCAFIVFLTGFLTFLEYMLGWNFGIDQLLFKEKTTAILTSAPGRMALNTSICFVMIDIVLFMVGTRTILFTYMAQLLIIPVGMITLLSFVGYLYGASPLYIGLQFSTAMALHTAVLFVMTCIGCLFARPEQGLMKNVSSDHFGGIMMRRILPVVVFVPLVLGWLKMRGERTELFSNEFGVSLVAICNLLIISLCVYIFSAYLNRLDTKRTTAEESLQESANRYRTLFNEAPYGICLADAETGTIIDCNQAMTALVGRDRMELIGQHQTILHPPADDNSAFSPTFKQHRADSDGQVLDTRIVTKTGEIREVEIKANHLDISGKTVLQGIFRDITDRKLAEGELRWKTAFLEAQVESSPDGILVVDNNGKRILINNRLIDFFNAPQEILNQSDDEALLEYVLSKVKNPEQFLAKIRYLNEHSNETSRDEMEFKDGTVFDRYSSGVFGKDGKCYGRIWTFRDITEHKIADEILQKANQQLKEHAKLKSELIDTVTHELRTPLCIFKNIISNAMVGALGEVSAKLRENLSIADQEINRFGRIIRDFIDISEIDQGKMQLHVKRFVMQSAVKKVVKSLTPQADAKSMRLAVIMPESPVFVDADYNRIVQVLTDLTDNAIKFTPKGGQIVVRVKDLEDEIGVDVEDSGIGISSDDISKVFSRFVQVEKLVGPGQHGTGVGLSIAKSIVEMHGGRIWAESTVGRGSNFCFVLPKTAIVTAAGEPSCQTVQA